MSRPGIILIVLLVGFVALAQLGLCPCWLMLDISAHHPHPDGHPERRHSHATSPTSFKRTPSRQSRC
ncbi:MAG: hypothetical protein HY784_12825 [Chloroflexi bacterium]|nr:hypothetical protein [Chloroflexota bacterium]